MIKETNKTIGFKFYAYTTLCPLKNYNHVGEISVLIIVLLKLTFFFTYNLPLNVMSKIEGTSL